MNTRPLLDRMGEKFTVGDGCWEWTGMKSTNGYGLISKDGKLQAAHRRLTIVPVYWREAKAFIELTHRHHLPGANGRFSVGVEDEEGTLRGVAVLGRTKARMLPHKHVLEVTRVATDGCPNACSALYGASCRIHQPHGYRKAITYILESEPGTSLRAAGWKPVAITDGGSWSRQLRLRDDKHPLDRKIRWECRHSELSDLRTIAEEEGT